MSGIGGGDPLEWRIIRARGLSLMKQPAASFATGSLETYRAEGGAVYCALPSWDQRVESV